MRHEIRAAFLLALTAGFVAGCATGNKPFDSSRNAEVIPAGVSAIADRDRGRTDNRRSRSDPREDARVRRQNADILVELGQRYFERGEYEIALEKLQSAISIEPRSANAHTMLAILYETINSADKAGEHYRRSVQFAPENGEVLNNYGSWLCRQKKYAEAEQQFRKALADPFYRSPLSASANAGTCALAAGNVDLASTYFESVLAGDSENFPALLGMADVAYQKQDYMRSRAFLQRAEALSPLDRTALQMAVRVEEQLGDARSAAAYRERLQD